ncbi:MAG TPA: hypothetical protein PLE99_10010 [Candidatus Thiothrix moscowensis]|uniref:hypothetical protein n=1 Tax=Thiothrix sp. UBA2016 TaxID=1947695 RepID=UPI0025F66C8B|nr:hypothetical protein [Thiothrix sp. UBA2016]HRJ53093.1 hypothetical protein [Candidatus Thiothrix moscowensis]HRJ93084.1 hypothetical protein [Candidatus Thiothrix moscowensis]
MERAVAAQDGTEVAGIGVKMAQAIAAESPVCKEPPYPEFVAIRILSYNYSPSHIPLANSKVPCIRIVIG